MGSLILGIFMQIDKSLDKVIENYFPSPSFFSQSHWPK